MKSLEVLGAGGGEVTGSQFLLTTNSESKILVDFGLHQGPKENQHQSQEKLSFNPETLEAVVVTHAHLDHIGGLPFLAKRGLKIPIFMTPETFELTKIALTNADGINPKMYPTGGVSWVMENVITIPYNKSQKIDGANVTFRDAGHILGSASAEISECREETIVFSGDLGNTPSRTVKPTMPPKEASVVVMETTYGDRNHSEENPLEQLKDAIEIIKKKKKGGTLLIPSFAIDRTQAILLLLKELKQSGHLGKIPVFLDSPMAIDVTEVYENNIQQLNEELQYDKDPFRFSNLHMTRDSKESRRIKNYHGPKIIVAGSGMMSGGRVERHASDYLPDENTVIVFVGFPAHGTPSREIVEGEKSVQLNGKTVNIQAQVRRLSSLSAHADQKQLLDWLRHISGGQTPTRHVILVHGENSSREGFAEKVMEMGIEVSIPNNGEKIDLQTNGYPN